MSYILDALKRADAERQRGTVPSLHARQVTTPAFPAAPGARNRLWLAAAGTALALGGIAAGLWIWRTPAVDERPVAADIALASPMEPKPLVQPLPAPTPLPATKPAAQSAAPERRAVVTPPSAAPPAAATPVPKPAPPKPKPDTVVAKAAVQGASAPAPQTPVPVAKASASRAASADVPLLSELPEDIRRQIPPLTINGVVYSQNPGQRLLLVNQQVLTQGSLAMPEVNLEEIRAHNSVFSFRGTRFRVAH